VIHLFKKGQVSTEYLVILSVVLVIALVVVYMVGGFSALGSGSLETQSKNYWGSASPFAIKSFKMNGTAIDLSITNGAPDPLTITDISIDGTSVYSKATAFGANEAKAISGKSAAECGAPGTPYVYNNVVITYTNGSFTGVTQDGVKPLMGKCS